MRSILVFLALIYIVAGKDINAIVKFNAKTYAFDGFPFLSDSGAYVPTAFEVVNNIQQNSYSLTLPNTTAVLESSTVIGGSLYQFSGAYGTSFLSKYTLPFTSSPVSPASQIELANQVQEIPAIFDATDNVAVALISRYLTLVNLTPLSVADSILAVVGSGKTPGSLVYNHNSNKIFYFQTNYCFAGYCQHIYEFKVNITSGKLSQSNEVFQPDYTTSFNNGALTGCSLDYSNSRIWCLNHQTRTLIQFPLSNLNNYVTINLPVGKTYNQGNVVFNFNTQRAYVATKGSLSYGILEVNLNTKAVVRSATFSGNDVISMTLAGSTINVGHEFKGLRQMSVINLDSLTAQLINLYV